MDNVSRLRAWLEETPYEGVILGRRDNFKWVTQENANAVVANEAVGVGFLIIRRDGTIDLVADSSDCPRMEREQNALKARGILVPWDETVEHFLEGYCGKAAQEGKRYASDTGIAATDNVQSELVDLRMLLNETEVDRYRQIGQECAAIVEGVAKAARPGQTEEEVAIELKKRCIGCGISPDCVLVGSDERILNYRHPVPTDKEIRNSLMVVLGGEKSGLNISMTRMVYFGEVPEEIRYRMQKTQYVFAVMQNLMKDGMEYQEYWQQILKVYEETGYPEEWKMHHQGGPTGYGCREFVVTPSTRGILKEGQAYAWNPTIQGTKCEETTYLKDGRVEILTRTKEWPCTVVWTPYGELDVADILVQ